MLFSKFATKRFMGVLLLSGVGIAGSAFVTGCSSNTDQSDEVSLMVTGSVTKTEATERVRQLIQTKINDDMKTLTEDNVGTYFADLQTRFLNRETGETNFYRWLGVSPQEARVLQGALAQKAPPSQSSSSSTKKVGSKDIEDAAEKVLDGIEKEVEGADGTTAFDECTTESCDEKRKKQLATAKAFYQEAVSLCDGNIWCNIVAAVAYAGSLIAVSVDYRNCMKCVKADTVPECRTDADCAAGEYCKDGGLLRATTYDYKNECVPLKADGQSCLRDDMCASGFCSMWFKCK